MNLPFRIARRYLFGKKSANAINIITGISVFGISVGSAALILILSVFNGFEDLLTSLFSAFNPDLKVLPVEGKVFVPDSSVIDQIKQLDGVEALSYSLEEIAFFEYGKLQDFGIIKGVEPHFNKVVDIDSNIIEGTFMIRDGERNLAVLGSGMRSKLGVHVEDEFAAIRVYMPKRNQRGSLGKPYRSRLLQPSGTFYIQQDFDTEYILTSMDFVRELLEYEEEIGALEIRLANGAGASEVKKEVQALMGEAFVVKDRYELDEAFFKIMNIEKWMSYAILSLTLVLVAFNIVGSLWMIVLDKRADIAILQAMGATPILVRNIFLAQGVLLCFLGLLIGTVFAVLFYMLQINFGIISIPAGFIINAYPISMRLPDFIIVALTVLVIGSAAAIPPALKAMRISPIFREE